MLFSSLAKALCEKFPGSKNEIPLDCEISDVALYDPSGALPPVDCLCIFTASQLNEAAALPLNVVCTGDLEKMPCEKLKRNDSNYVLIPEESSAGTLYYIMSLFGGSIKQQKLHSDLFYMLLADEDLNSIFSKFSNETSCPMLAVDITGKVLAYSKPFRVDHPHWLHSVEVGYLDKYLIEYILSYRVKHNMSISPQTFILYCDRLKLHIKVIRVISNGDIIAYAFMGSRTGEFPDFSDKFMALIAKRLLNMLIGARNYSSFRFNMHQNVLSDIINGASEEETAQRISVANLSFPPHMRAIVFRQSWFRENEFLCDALMPAVSALLPNSPKLYQRGAAVALVESDRLGNLPEEITRGLKKLSVENSLLVGVSNVFSKPEKFAVHYRQAERTASFARRQNHVSGLFFYSDYAFYIMLDGIEDKSELEYVEHPLLPELEKYDEEKNTEFYETLKIFAMTGFSKNKTAEIMFLHRNTVNYRIQQIADLYGLDFTDSSLLFKLQYSFYIDLYLKHKYVLPNNLIGEISS